MAADDLVLDQKGNVSVTIYVRLATLNFFPLSDQILRPDIRLTLAASYVLARC